MSSPNSFVNQTGDMSSMTVIRRLSISRLLVVAFPDGGRKARKVRKAYGNGTSGEGRLMGEGRKYDPRACGAASGSADPGPRSGSPIRMTGVRSGPTSPGGGMGGRPRPRTPPGYVKGPGRRHASRGLKTKGKKGEPGDAPRDIRGDPGNRTHGYAEGPRNATRASGA